MASRVSSAPALRVRRSRRRRAQQAPSASPSMLMSEQYRRFRAVVLLMLLIVVFGCLWLLNGDWTAQYLIAQFAISLGGAWAFHLIVSSTELAGPILRPYFEGLPPWVPGLIIFLSLPFGVLDVLSSAIGVTPYLAWSGFTGIELDTFRTMAGLLVAFLPERMLFFLVLALVSVLQR